MTLTEVAVATGPKRWRRRDWACWRPTPGAGRQRRGARLRAWSPTTCTRPASCLAPATPRTGRPAPPASTSAWAPPGGCAASRRWPQHSRPRRPTTAATGLEETHPRVAHMRPGGGGIWWVGRDGALTAIRDAKGLHYLHIMLQRPGADIAAIDLSDTAPGHPGTGAADRDIGGMLDKQALSTYRRRLTEIDADLDRGPVLGGHRQGSETSSRTRRVAGPAARGDRSARPPAGVRFATRASAHRRPEGDHSRD